MTRPLREHFEMSTSMGEVLRVFDYIEALEKYINNSEVLQQKVVSLPNDEVMEKIGKEKADNSWVSDIDNDISGIECKEAIKEYYIQGFKDGFNYYQNGIG